MIGTLDAIVSTLIATSSTLTAIISTLIATIGNLNAFALSAFRRYFASMADAVLRRGHGIRDVFDALQPCNGSRNHRCSSRLCRHLIAIRALMIAASHNGRRTHRCSSRPRRRRARGAAPPPPSAHGTQHDAAASAFIYKPAHRRT